MSSIVVLACLESTMCRCEHRHGKCI